MILVVIESPYAGNIELNLRYLRACMHDCLMRGEAPFASHALYTQPGVLRDEIAEEREMGMEAGFAWGKHADKVVVYTDLGLSGGMKAGIARAQKRNQKVEHRQLGGEWAWSLEERHHEETFGCQAPLDRVDNPEGGGFWHCINPRCSWSHDV